MFFLDEELKISEKEIQILYQTHPYLIEKQFINQKVINQFPIPSGFADIVVFLKGEIIVIELKVNSLEESHLLQLNEYLRDISKLYPEIKLLRGILIGKMPKKNIKRSLKILPFPIKILILNKDICTKIKICENCRLANDVKNKICIFCSKDLFI